MKHLSKFLAIFLFYSAFALSYISYSEDLEDQLKKISILVPSPDIRSELWGPHFHFLFKHWPDLLDKHSYIPIYLVSNLKSYKHPRVQSILIGKEKSWSDDLKAGLESVKTEFVILLLDDYILTQDVNTKRLGQIIHLMERTNGVYAQLYINPELNDGPFADGIDDLIIRAKAGDSFKKIIFKTKAFVKRVIFNDGSKDVWYGRYRNSLQACIWRVKTLKRLLMPMESAWDFELIGSKRSEQITEPFYLVTKTPVFQYFQAASQKKYNRSAIEAINRLGFKFAPTALPIRE